MAGQYELKKFLRHVSIGILKDYFAWIDWDPGVQWEELSNIDPLFHAIRGAPENIRARIDQDFQLVNDMATEGGVKALIDEGRQAARGGLDLGEELKDIAGLENKVLRVYLDHPAEGEPFSLFDVARGFNRADNLPTRSWRKRSGVPAVEHAKSMGDEIAKKLDESRVRLADALQSYYRIKEGRGYGCEVHHFERDDKLYWFAYVRDYDRVSLEWIDDGVHPRESKPLFEVIFVHSNEDRYLDIYVKGDSKTVEDLQTLWARSVLGTEDLGTPPERGVEYELNVLKTKRHFKFRQEDGITDVRISALRLSRIGDKRNRRIRLEANTRGDRDAVFDLMEQVFKSPADMAKDQEAYRLDKRLALDLVNITQAEFKFVFVADTRTGKKTVPARVSHPDSCSLKHEPKEEIARKYLREWKIDVSQSAQPDSSGA